MNKTARRILNQIAKHSGVTSVGLVACDLQLTTDTVRRHVNALIAGGRVCLGHDGRQLELTDGERQERAVDARVATHR